MKKVFLTLGTVLALNLSSAQEVYSTYTAGSETIKSAVSVDDGHVYLDLQSDGKYALSLKKKDRARFKTFLDTARVKYNEWKKTAIDNSVVDMHKDIDNISLNAAFHYASWEFWVAKLRAIFWVNKDGGVRFYLHGGKITSNTNRYIKSETTMIDITDDADFDSLLLVLKDSVVQSFIDSKNTQTNLFD